MNPFSRHRFCLAQQDSQGRMYLSDRIRFKYRDLPDNRVHVSKGGERLFALAGTYFRGLWRPAGLFWIIADFQPDPIQDATLDIVAGTALVIPSIRTVTEEIFNERRFLEVPE